VYLLSAGVTRVWGIVAVQCRLAPKVATVLLSTLMMRVLTKLATVLQSINVSK
jgi:hypothetical protein